MTNILQARLSFYFLDRRHISFDSFLLKFVPKDPNHNKPSFI